MPFKFVKFNKYKHKDNEWIKAEVLRSIKYRDKLYKNLQNTDRSSHLYPPIFENKNKSGLEESKSKTWSVINEMIYKTEHNIKGIKATSLDGKQLNGPQNIAVSFNNFFVNIGPSLTKNARHISEKNIPNALKLNDIDGIRFD